MTLYTTLESCAQCSGIMALAKLGRVVFLQTDPGQYCIGNIMRNMTVATGLPAPMPIPAKSFKFPAHERLDEAYLAFRSRDVSLPMVTQADGGLTADSRTTSITSFLCTKAAREIFASGAPELAGFRLVDPEFKPAGSTPSTLTNHAVLEEARSFVTYAINTGQRGTPHHT